MMGELAEIFTSLVGILRTILEVALMTVILEGLIGIIMPMFGTALTVLVMAIQRCPIVVRCIEDLLSSRLWRSLLL